MKNVLLEIFQNSQENTCTRVSFLINFIKKEALAQVFSCRFCEISKNAFFTEHLWATASDPKRVLAASNFTKKESVIGYWLLMLLVSWEFEKFSRVLVITCLKTLQNRL